MTDCRKCELNDNCPGFADCPKMEQPMNKTDSVLTEFFNWLRTLHRHRWLGMEWDEWQQHGGMGSPDWVCTKCGDRRFWSETK